MYELHSFDDIGGAETPDIASFQTLSSLLADLGLDTSPDKFQCFHQPPFWFIWGCGQH